MRNTSSPSYCNLTIKVYAYRDHCFVQNGISSRKLGTNSASSPALSKAMNLDSIVERAIYVCLDDFQDIDPPQIVKTYPLVDIISGDPVI